MASTARALNRLFDEVAVALKPPPKLSYSVWAERYFRVPAQTSATPGRFKPWKPQRGLLDAMGDPLLPRVSVIKAARVGYTKCLMASIAADAANDPCSTILLMPTDDDCRGMAVDEVDPAFKETPALRGLMAVGRNDGRNTLLQRQIAGGGSLKIIAARAPRNLRRHTARKLYVDEADGMEVTSEGDPIDLAEKRTLSFADRKIIIGSTPTDDIRTFVGKLYAKSDQRVFRVPCPHCGHRFEILWEHIQYPPGKPEEAYCVCPSGNGCVIEDRHKLAMVEAGDWEITRPEVKGHAGFRLNALVSLFANAAWGNLAREYEDARAAGPYKLMVFYNTVLGLVWTDAVDSLDENKLMARAEPFALVWDEKKSRWREDIPREVLYITAGVDVQTDRLEILFVGWSRNQRWFLGHEVVRGATNLQSTWDELDALLKTQWTHPLGGKIGVEAAAVDSGDGNRTQDVYNFCGPRSGRKIIAIKGREGPIDVLKATTSKKARRSGARLYIVGVDQVKADLISSTSVDAGNPGALRFSSELSREWFVQFTSERRKVQYPKGRPKVTFERIGYRAAEALDCAVYGTAVRSLCRFNWDERQKALDVKSDQPGKPGIKDMLRKLHG
ncbi:phage terminase large subunit family protein [Terrarubrum flagellatum]|uniref:phage terminase large subunit family protein n=1 Tax=Terrirubrum flagellatum TaxID=2895980 RepID=UPI003144F6F7